MRRLSLLFLMSLASCGGGEPAAPAAELDPVVMTTFYPTTWMAERISGGLVEVRCPLPPDADPIFWQPERDTLAAYQRAALIVVNGAGFEQWVDGASLPPSRVVNTSKGFEDRWLEYADATTHSHGAAGEHTHVGLDGHTWVDPINAQAQAEAILEGMVRAFPEHEQAFRANYRDLDSDLVQIDRAFTLLSIELGGHNLLASHPAYNYLAQRYWATIRNFDFDPDTALDEEARAELRAALVKDRANILLWEGEPVDLTGGVDGVIGVHVSPCEQPPGEGDYLSVMLASVEALQEALDSW